MKIFLFVLLLCSNYRMVSAQNKPLDDDSMIKKIIVPIELEMEDNRQPIIYNVPSQDLSLNYNALPVKPLSFQPNKKGEYNWLRLGAGNINNKQILGSLLVPIGANNLQCIAGYSSASDGALQAHQHLLANVSYQYFSEKNDANIGAEFSNNNQNRYGFNQVNALAQNFAVSKIYGKWMPKDKSIKRNTSIVNGSAAYLKTNNNLSELKAIFDCDFLFTKSKGELVIAIYGQYNNMYNDSSNRDISYIQPTLGYQSNQKNTDWKIGVSGIINSSIFLPMPYFQINHKLGNKSLLHFSAKGQALQTSLHDALLQNPFAEYQINAMQIGRLYQMAVGYTFAIKNFTTVNAKIAFNDYRNAIRFNSQRINNNQIINVDFVNAVSIQYQFGLLYHATQDMQIGMNASLQKYSDVVIYHLPTMDINAFCHFKLIQKINCRLNYVHQNGIINNNKPLDLLTIVAPIHDLHAELNFPLMKYVTIFAQVNNILNQQNQRWYGYNSYKRNFVVGLQLHP